MRSTTVDRLFEFLRPSHGASSLTVLVVLMACGSGETAGEVRLVEEQAASRVAEVAVPESLRAIFAADVCVEGCWIWNWLPGFDSTALCVERTGAMTFEVEFLQSTDYSAPREHRTSATWSGVGLVLAEPDKVLSEPTRTLYPARVMGEDCLVPDACLSKWRPDLPLFDGNCGEEEYAFRRAEDGLVEKVREQWKAFFASLESAEDGEEGR